MSWNRYDLTWGDVKSGCTVGIHWSRNDSRSSAGHFLTDQAKPGETWIVCRE